MLIADNPLYKYDLIKKEYTMSVAIKNKLISKYSEIYMESKYNLLNAELFHFEKIRLDVLKDILKNITKHRLYKNINITSNQITVEFSCYGKFTIDIFGKDVEITVSQDRVPYDVNALKDILDIIQEIQDIFSNIEIRSHIQNYMTSFDLMGKNMRIFRNTCTKYFEDSVKNSPDIYVERTLKLALIDLY